MSAVRIRVGIPNITTTLLAIVYHSSSSRHNTSRGVRAVGNASQFQGAVWDIAQGHRKCAPCPQQMQGGRRRSAIWTGSEVMADSGQCQRASTCNKYAEGRIIGAPAASLLQHQISKGGSFVKRRHSAHKERNKNADYMQRCSRSLAIFRRAVMRTVAPAHSQ